MSEQANTKISIGKETHRKLEGITKKLGVSIAECIDHVVNEFFDYTGSQEVNVTFKLPERLNRLIESQNYFGRSRDEFFADAVRSLLSCIIGELPTLQVKALEKKYGLKDEDTAFSL